MGFQRQPNFGLVLFIFGTTLLSSTLWCTVEGRGNYIRGDSSGTKVKVCKSRECIDAAHVIYNSRDTSFHPCNNFYQFACGKWIENNPVPENKTKWDQFLSATTVANERLKDILEGEDSRDDNQSIKDARKFYRACLDVDTQAERNMEILLERLAAWGGWPIASKQWKEERFDWKKLLIHLIRTNHVSPLFKLNVETDRKNTTQNVIVISEAEVKCRPFMASEALAAWKQFLINVAQSVAKAGNQTISKKRLDADVNDVTKLYFRVCQKMAAGFSDREDDFKLYNAKTIQELQNMTDGAEPLQETSKINWLNLLNDFLEGANIEMKEHDRVIVQQPDFLISLVRTVDKVAQRTLANYLLWHMVDDMLEDISELRQSNYDYQEKITGATGVVPRWQTCVTTTSTYYPHAVGYEYVRQHFDEDAKENAKELVSNILESFIEELREVDWMDGETRLSAIEKAQSMILNVGYPDWYDNASTVDNIYAEYVTGSSHLLNLENIKSSVSLQGAKSLTEENDRETWLAEVVVVNAYYSVEMNAIYIPAGIFQAPFYIKGRPEALNYGAIGAIIGHEISHAFDVQGRMADKFGNLAQWWSADTLKTYLVKKGCIEEQYNEYPVPELQEESTEDVPDQLDGTGTISENIADNGGVQEAFAAYLRSLHQHGTEPRLPGLIHYSPQQLFYIGYASVWCESGSLQTLVEDILTDTHSPNKYRVLIPLGNSKDFAKVWKCQKKEFEMNPVQKCQFW